MKTGRLRRIAAEILCIPAWALASGGLQVEEALAGGSRVIVAFEDSVRAPDLGSIRLQGHTIEHAVFLEQSDSFEISPDLWDLTDPNGAKLVPSSPGDSGTLLLDAPLGRFARPGILLADTANGGMLVKVIESRPVQAGATSTRYLVKTQPAFLNEALLEGEIRFRTRSDFSVTFPDHHAKAALEAKDGGGGEMEVDLRQARVLFQPSLSGTLRVRNGMLELIHLRLQGELEVSGNFSTWAGGQGRFSYEKPLGSGRVLTIPLGHGLCLRLRQNVTFRVEAEMASEEFLARITQRLRQSVTADLVFNLNRWHPGAETQELASESTEMTTQGSGSLRFSLEPRLEFSVGGNPGPSLAFSPSTRVSGQGLLETSTQRNRFAGEVDQFADGLLLLVESHRRVARGHRGRTVATDAACEHIADTRLSCEVLERTP
jgi:hypothetical protein